MQFDDFEEKPLEPQDPFLGTTFAQKYEITSFLGGGATGRVYKAAHLFIRQTVAIKILSAHLSMQESKLQRFKQEALSISCLKHPNIVGVLDFGQADNGQPYLVMEYIEGNSLSDLLMKEGPLPFSRSLPLFIQACDALAHAHDQGIIHRDLKPSNLMLVAGEDGKDLLKIVDFGLAKQLTEGEDGFLSLTQTGEVFGSPYYMSPEQVRGQKLGIGTDIYSMGIVIFETLTGKPPFYSEDPVEVFNAQINDSPGRLTNLDAPAHVRAYLELMVLKAMDKNPGKRFASMAAFKKSLEYISQAPNGLDRSGTIGELFLRRCKIFLLRSSKQAWSAVAVSVVLTSVAAFLLYTFAIPHDSSNKSNATTLKSRVLDVAQVKDLEQASNLAQQANSLLQARRYRESESAFKSSLAITDKIDGAESSSSAKSQIGLATCYYNQKQYSAAQALYEKGISTLEKLYGKDYAELALPASQLGFIYQSQGKFLESKRLFEQSISISKRGLTGWTTAKP